MCNCVLICDVYMFSFLFRFLYFSYVFISQCVKKCNTGQNKNTKAKSTFHCWVVSMWNALPERLTKITNFVALKNELMCYLELSQ